MFLLFTSVAVLALVINANGGWFASVTALADCGETRSDRLAWQGGRRQQLADPGGCPALGLILCRYGVGRRQPQQSSRYLMAGEHVVIRWPAAPPSPCCCSLWSPPFAPSLTISTPTLNPWKVSSSGLLTGTHRGGRFCFRASSPPDCLPLQPSCPWWFNISNDILRCPRAMFGNWVTRWAMLAIGLIVITALALPVIFSITYFAGPCSHPLGAGFMSIWATDPEAGAFWGMTASWLTRTCSR